MCAKDFSDPPLRGSGATPTDLLAANMTAELLRRMQSKTGLQRVFLLFRLLTGLMKCMIVIPSPLRICPESDNDT